MNQQKKRTEKQLRRRTIVAAALTVTLPLCAMAKDYPVRAIRMIVPFAAGGPTDVVARMLAEKMSANIGQPIVVENRGGAGGALGTEAIAKAAPDGYTIGMATASTHAFAPACNKDIGYDPVNDFSMLGIVSTTPSMAFVKKDSPYAGLQEILKASQDSTQQVTWGTPGVCSNTHFLIALVNRSGNGKIVPVPYRGNSAANNDLMAGMLTLGSDAVTPQTVGMVESNMIRPIALTERSNLPMLKDVPSYAEIGVDIGSFVVWQGLVGPAGMPEDMVTTINEALVASLRDPDLKQRWQGAGITPYSDPSPKTMRAFVSAGYEESRTLAQELGMAENN